MYYNKSDSTSKAPYPHVTAELARLHVADLVESAERHRRAAGVRQGRSGRVRLALYRVLRRPPRVPAPAEGVVLELRIRYARAEDDAALRRLAALDSATVPQPPLLLAEVDGELHVALSLWDGRAIADPFRKTQALVELLAVRAGQIHAAANALLDLHRAPPRFSPASAQGHQRS